MDNYNYNFVCLKNHKLMVWILIMFLEYIPLIAKFTCLKLNTNQKCSKHYWKWIIFIFPNVCFFYQMCTIPFFNWKGLINWWLERAIRLELMKIVFTTDLNTFGSKVFLTLKIMDFEILLLIIVVHVYVIEGMNI